MKNESDLERRWFRNGGMEEGKVGSSVPGSTLFREISICKYF